MSLRGPAIAFAAASVAVYSALGSPVHVLTYHNDNTRSGANLNETLLTPSNVNAASFGKLFTYNVDGCVYAQPLYVSGLSIPGKGARNVVFVATQHNSVYAFDADIRPGATGALLWQTNLGPAAATPSPDFGTRYGSFSAILPEVGITGTPAIDLASGTLFVDTFTHEGTAYFHKLHALNVTNGAERPFSPVIVRAAVPGIGVTSSNGVMHFEAKQHIQRTAVTLAGGRVYLAFAGYEDTNPYHGWVIGFDPATLQPLTNYIFNTTPNSTIAAFGPDAGEGGIWMAGCGLSVDAAGDLFFGVGNGSFNVLNNSGGTEYGDSFIRLSTSNGLRVADYFTPYNQEFLAENNLDVGSGGMLLLPDQPGPFRRLMLGGSKQSRLYLMNRDRMTAGDNHYNAGGNSDAVVQTVSLGGAAMCTPAYFDRRVYCAGVGDVLAAFPVIDGQLSIAQLSVSARAFPYPGATPSVSANGSSNGIVWALRMGSPGLLTAYSATNLAVELFNGTHTNGIKFSVPTIANGNVYVGGPYTLSVFGLLAASSNIWKSAHFGANAGNPAIAGDSADPDNDKLLNIWEYAIGSDPNHFDASRRPLAAIVSNSFRFQFTRNLFATDLTYVLQRTSDLGGAWLDLFTWTGTAGWVTNNPGAAISESSVTGAAPDEYVNVTITAAPAGARAFYRLLLGHQAF